MQTMNTETPSQSEMTALARAALREHRTLFLVQGIVMIVLGLIAVALPQLATLAVEILVGWLFVIGGIVRLVAVLQARSVPGFWWSLLTAVLAILVGGILLLRPFAGVLTLTMVLILLFVLEGVFSIIAAIEFRRVLASSWMWMVLSGIVDLALAVIILSGWPGTAAWAIGLLVGINLIFAGVALAMTAAAARDRPV